MSGRSANSNTTKRCSSCSPNNTKLQESTRRKMRRSFKLSTRRFRPNEKVGRHGPCSRLPGPAALESWRVCQPLSVIVSGIPPRPRSYAQSRMRYSGGVRPHNLCESSQPIYGGPTGMSDYVRLLGVRLLRRLAGWRRWMLRASQLGIFLIAGVSAFLLRFDFEVTREWRPYLIAALCIWGPVKIVVFHFLGLDRGWWRYTSIPDFLRLGVGNILGSALGCIGILILAPHGFPRSLYLLDFLLCSIMTAGARLAVRVAYEAAKPRNAGEAKRVLVYGAGDAGVALVREIRQNPALAYDVIGFVEDSLNKRGHSIQRTRILGTGEDLALIARTYEIEMVLIAVPSATGAQMAAILKRCQEAGVAYKTIPGLGEIIESSGLASQIRAVAVEDLLGRNPIHLEEHQIRGTLQGKVVLVTGAAGSIGSELCRQIARFHPAGIVGFEIAESPLFEIDREMRQSFPRIPFY